MGNDLKEARKLTRLEFERTVNKYLFMSLEQIQKLMKDPEVKKRTPMIDMIVVSIAYKALIEGDERRFTFLLDRTIGQVVRRVRVEHEVEDMPKTVPVEMTMEERLEMLERYKKVLQSKKEEAIDVSPVVGKD